MTRKILTCPNCKDSHIDVINTASFFKCNNCSLIFEVANETSESQKKKSWLTNVDEMLADAADQILDDLF